MISAHVRRGLREISRRRGRSTLTIATIAVAIAGIWLFAIPFNIDDALSDRVRDDAMHTARLAPTAADLTAVELGVLRSVEGVAALDTRTLGRADARLDGRTTGVILVGVEDFADQQVNIVSLDDGSFPSSPGELVTDRENARTGRLPAEVGDEIAVRTHDGRWATFSVAGRGGTVRYSSEVAGDAPVLYVQNAEVQRVMGYPAANSIDVLAVDGAPDAVTAMVTELRTTLATQLPDLEYWDVLEVWRPGTWPGSEDFGNFVVVFYVIAAVALVAALVLIATTMNTFVREQAREIAVMKAIGGRSRTIAGGFLQIALVLGGLGTIVGIVIGVPLSNAVMAFMSDEFGGLQVAWRLNGLALALSLAVGLGGTALASWPALHRASRTTVRQAIADHGVTATFGIRRIDQIVSNVPLRSRWNQIGVRNATRRAGRSVATAVPIGLAVGTMLGFGAVLVTAVEEDLRSFDLEGGDIVVWSPDPGLDVRAGALIESVRGVDDAHPMIYSSVELDGERYVWGLTAESTYDHDVISGRWFTAAEVDDAARVVVLGEAAASTLGASVGDVVSAETRRGPIELEVIGVDGHLVNNGQGLFAPYSTVLDYEGWSTTNYWVRTADPSPATVDEAVAGIRAALEAGGYEVSARPRYPEREQNVAENRLVVTVVLGMGLPIVAIGMIGMLSAMASNVLDRTREIGVLRSVGARRRDLRAVFRAEALLIAIVGWLIGVPVGLVLARSILWVLERRFEASFGFEFPPWMVLLALVVTIVVTTFVVRLPVRRVVRMSPGAALRYE